MVGAKGLLSSNTQLKLVMPGGFALSAIVSRPPPRLPLCLLKDAFQKAHELPDRCRIIYWAARIFRSQYVGVGAVDRQKPNPNAVGAASPLTSCLWLNMHRPTVLAVEEDKPHLCSFCAAFQLGFWIMKVAFSSPHILEGFPIALNISFWIPESPHHIIQLFKFFPKSTVSSNFFFWDE